MGDNVLFVMSEATWEFMKQREYDFANTQPDPIEYLKSFSTLHVVIDNSVPFGFSEMWEKEKYWKYIAGQKDK